LTKNWRLNNLRSKRNQVRVRPIGTLRPCGRIDQDKAESEPADLHLPTDLPVSVPSQLVEQRPDIRAAEEELHAASAQVGIATANLLPSFTINGGWRFGRWNNLEKQWKSMTSYLFANLRVPAHHIGGVKSAG
jgi:outer membrane protein TolC